MKTSAIFRHLLEKFSLLVAILLVTSKSLSAEPTSNINSPGAVISFTLIDADADVPLAPLIDGHVINLAKLPTTNLNIRANLAPERVGSVAIVLNGSERIENVVPYAAKGDTDGDYFLWIPPVGTNQITAIPFSEPKGRGFRGESLSITFTVVNDGSRPELLIEDYWDFSDTFSFLLEQGESDKFYFTLESSDDQMLPTPCAITAIDDATNDVPSWLAFPSSTNQGTGQDFFVNTDGLDPGVYTATVVFGPVQGYDMEIAKVILEVSATPLPFLEFDPFYFNPAFEQGEEGRTDYIITASDGNENGAAQILAIDHTTNQPASWLSFTSATNFNTLYDFFVQTDMPAGTYHATLYARAFTLISGKYKNAQADLILTLRPAFKVASMVLINADTDQFMRFLFDGSVIDLTTLPTSNLNIQARTYPETTGSVQFMVNGVPRTENFFPYAAFGDTDGDYFSWNPEPGNYQIMATPFSKQQLGGSRGESLTINILIQGLATSTGNYLVANQGQSLQLKSYPNPSSNELFVELNATQTQRVSLDIYSTTNVLRVFEGPIETGKPIIIPVDASKWKNGIYYMKLNTATGAVSKKLVVEH